MNSLIHKKWFGIVCAVITIMFLYLFTTNNYRFYEQTIIKVTKAVNRKTTNKQGVNGNEEQYYLQHITGRIMNGDRKGETITFENAYSFSEVFAEKYRKGDRLFIEIKKDGSVAVNNVKRDAYIVLLISILIACILLTAKKRGIFTILSLILNVSAFYFTLTQCKLGDFLQWMWIVLIAFFNITTLLLVSGIHKKTFGAVVSSFATVGIIYVLYMLFVWNDDSIPYEMIAYAYGPLPLKEIYKVSVIFGSLGAIMDVCITINSSVCELVTTTKNLTVRSLIQSVREIGYDIMGTMVNVMFFSYLSSSLPIVILKIQSGFGLGVLYRYEYIFDLVRFLLAAIGIVLAIPISGVIAATIVWKGLKHTK